MARLALFKKYANKLRDIYREQSKNLYFPMIFVIHFVTFFIDNGYPEDTI